MTINANINSFEQGAVRGQLDLNVVRSGILSAVAGGTIKAGDRVKFDTGYSGFVPKVVKAAVGDDAIGIAIYDVKQSTFSSGDKLSIVLFAHVCVMYLEYNATLSPGDTVEQDSNGLVIATASGKDFGRVLDPGTTGTIGRILVTLSNS